MTLQKSCDVNEEDDEVAQNKLLVQNAKDVKHSHRCCHLFARERDE